MRIVLHAATRGIGLVSRCRHFASSSAPRVISQQQRSLNPPRSRSTHHSLLSPPLVLSFSPEKTMASLAWAAAFMALAAAFLGSHGFPGGSGSGIHGAGVGLAVMLGEPDVLPTFPVLLGEPGGHPVLPGMDGLEVVGDNMEEDGVLVQGAVLVEEELLGVLAEVCADDQDSGLVQGAVGVEEEVQRVHGAMGVEEELLRAHGAMGLRQNQRKKSRRRCAAIPWCQAFIGPQNFEVQIQFASI